MTPCVRTSEYTNICRHIEKSLRCANISGDFNHCGFLHAQNDSTFRRLWHIPIFTNLNTLFSYFKMNYPVHVKDVITEQNWAQFYWRLLCNTIYISITKPSCFSSTVFFFFARCTFINNYNGLPNCVFFNDLGDLIINVKSHSWRLKKIIPLVV